jgi:hypothetical protein
VTAPMSHAYVVFLEKAFKDWVLSDTFGDQYHMILLSLIFHYGMQWIVQSTKKILVVSIIWKKQSLILFEVSPTLKSHTSSLAS